MHLFVVHNSIKPGWTLVTFQINYSVIQIHVNTKANVWRQFKVTGVFVKMDSEDPIAKVIMRRNHMQKAICLPGCVMYKETKTRKQGS